MCSMGPTRSLDARIDTAAWLSSGAVETNRQNENNKQIYFHIVSPLPSVMIYHQANSEALEHECDLLICNRFTL